MRSLILKEFRQGRPLLFFSLVVALLLAAAYAVVGRLYVVELAQDNWMVTGGPSPLNTAFSVLILVLPLVVAIFAGIGLFAGEADHNTVPVLLALPLSRVRIWLGKILGGLGLTAAGTVIIVGLGRLLLSDAYHSLPVSPYLPDLCLALLFVFAVSAFMSSVSSYTIAALVATLIIGGALSLGLGFLWGGFGAPLLGYNPITDLALWGLIAAPALLFASALAIDRGELLQSLRKHAFGIPALLVGLLITLLLVSGIARIATRYSRARVRVIDAWVESPGSSLLAMVARADPVPYQRWQLGKGWTRRPYDWEQGQYGHVVNGPLYRSDYGVLLDLKTGRELLRLRSAFDDNRFQMAVSPDRRFAAAITGPTGLTWGTRTWTDFPWKDFPEKLEVFDLVSHRRLFWEVPAPMVKRTGIHVGDLKWSHSGDYLAFTTISSGAGGPYSSFSGFYAMKPDGSEVRDLAIKPMRWGDWIWSPTENVIYATDRGRIYRVTLDGKAPKAIWTPDAASADAKLLFFRAGLSPDGRWLAIAQLREETRKIEHISRRGPGRSPSTQHPGRWTEDRRFVTYAAIRAVRTDGSGSQLLWSALNLPGDWDLSLSSHVAWSPDGKVLHFLLRPSAKQAQLLRWRPDEPTLTPVASDLRYATATLTALPESGGVMVYPVRGWGERRSAGGAEVGVPGHEYPERVRLPAASGPAIVTDDGRVRPFPSATDAVKFADANDFVTIDAGGRLITLAGPSDRQRIQATDLKTGRSERIYP
jgi:ABC-type transport system involved in multi-copper enzyme maturation permease subunit